MSRAEDLKKTEGDCSGDPARGIGNVSVKDDQGLVEGEIKRSLLNEIIHGRLEETLRLIRDRLPKDALQGIGSGVFLTGGTRRMRGLTELANEVFGLSIYVADQVNMSGVHASFRDPQYSTAVGLIRYAQILDAEREAGSGSFLGRILKLFWPFGS